MAAFANPKLAVKAGTSKKLQAHIAVATVLQPDVAGMAAKAEDVEGRGEDALPSALKAAKDDDDEITFAEAKQRVQDAWAKLPEAFPNAFLVGGEPVAFIESLFDAQCWVHRNERLKQVRASRGNNIIHFYHITTSPL